MNELNFENIQIFQDQRANILKIQDVYVSLRTVSNLHPARKHVKEGFYLLLQSTLNIAPEATRIC